MSRSRCRRAVPGGAVQLHRHLDVREGDVEVDRAVPDLHSVLPDHVGESGTSGDGAVPASTRTLRSASASVRAVGGLRVRGRAR